MNSPQASVNDITMSSAHDAQAVPLSDGDPGGNTSVQLTAFTLFSDLPKEIQDMVWDEAVKAQGQQSIYFFQIYSCKNRQGREVSKRVRLDKHSTAAYLARIMPTCKASKAAVERNFRLAVANGEQFQPVTVSVQFGETQVQVNVRDIVSFGTLRDGSALANGNLLTDRRCVAHPGSFFQPVYRATFRVPAQWSWIRRVALSLTLSNRPVELHALTGLSRCDCTNCPYCINWNLTGLRNLEEVIYIKEGLPKPPVENPYRLLTKISSDIFNGPFYDWTDLMPRCEDFNPQIPDGEEEDENEMERETGKSLAASQKPPSRENGQLTPKG